MIDENLHKIALFEYASTLFFMISDTKYSNVTRLLSDVQITDFLSLT